MNKSLSLMALFTITLLLSACAEKNQFEEVLLNELKNEPDVKDYKLDPKQMTACVLEELSGKMPGVFSGDPERLKAYASYTKLLTLKQAKDPQKAMDELRQEFGSAQGLLKAKNNYTQSLVDCQTTMITNTEPVDVDTKPSATAPETTITPAAVDSATPVK